MKCRQCGTDIAEKALICFRCGTATAEAKFKAVPLAPRRRISRVVIAVLIAFLVLLALLLINSDVLVSDGVRPLSDPGLAPALAQSNLAFSQSSRRNCSFCVPT
jgi:hypothetical protein